MTTHTRLYGEKRRLRDSGEADEEGEQNGWILLQQQERMSASNGDNTDIRDLLGRLHRDVRSAESRAELLGHIARHPDVKYLESYRKAKKLEKKQQQQQQQRKHLRGDDSPFDVVPDPTLVSLSEIVSHPKPRGSGSSSGKPRVRRGNQLDDNSPRSWLVSSRQLPHSVLILSSPAVYIRPDQQAASCNHGVYSTTE